MSDQDKDKSLFCSFCGKNQHEVKKLIAGPSVFICDECIDLCNDIIKEELSEASVSEDEGLLGLPGFEFITVISALALTGFIRRKV